MKCRLALFLTIALVSSVALAGSSKAFTVSPPIVDIEVEPGSAQTVFINVTNEEAVAKTYAFVVQKFIPKGERGQQDFLPPEETSGLPEWMYFDDTSIRLSPSESRNVPVGLRIPSDARAGGHYVALFFSEQLGGAEQGQALTTVSRTGVLFLITVTGDTSPKFILDDFRAEQTSYQHLPVGFRMKLTNLGGTHAAPQGEIRIQNIFGSTVAKLTVNQEGSRVLPGSSRSYAPVWSVGVVEPGTGYLTRLRNEIRNFGFGSYTARLALTGPGSVGATEVVASFSVWPKTLLYTLAVSGVVLLVLLLIFKKLVIYFATRR